MRSKVAVLGIVNGNDQEHHTEPHRVHQSPLATVGKGQGVNCTGRSQPALERGGGGEKTGRVHSKARERHSQGHVGGVWEVILEPCLGPPAASG